MDNLKKLREQKGITQVSLSVKLEVAQETISKYEAGTAFPTVDKLCKLADIFNTSTDYLLDRTNIKSTIDSVSGDFLSDDEVEIINIYKSLSKENKARMFGYAEGMINKL